MVVGFDTARYSIRQPRSVDLDRHQAARHDTICNNAGTGADRESKVTTAQRGWHVRHQPVGDIDKQVSRLDQQAVAVRNDGELPFRIDNHDGLENALDTLKKLYTSGNTAGTTKGDTDAERDTCLANITRARCVWLRHFGGRRRTGQRRQSDRQARV